MGKLDKNNSTKKYWQDIRNSKPILSFSIIFLVSFFALIFAPSAIKNIPNQVVISFGNSVIDSYSNSQANARANSLYNYDEINQQAEFTATYNQYLNSKLAGTQKVIAVNMNLEYYLPIILLFSLIIAYKTNYKVKIKKLIIGESMLLIYLLFKIVAVAFDNYNYPESAIIELNGLFGGMVYHFSHLLNIVGNSPNFILPLIIVAALFYKDIEKIV